MQKAGKILISQLKTLVTGSSNRLGNALTKHLAQKGSNVYSVDQFNPFGPDHRYGPNHHFQQGDLADEKFLKDYLHKIGPIDALVNCAGFRSSYNYFLTYLISKQLLEKFKQNEINKYGCRGCIINLVYPESQNSENYFQEQDDFIKKYQIPVKTIDDDVYRLAELLTAARVRCNTLMIDSKLSEQHFTSMVCHILEDQYIAGQVINMEDNLRHRELTSEELIADLSRGLPKKQLPTEHQKYIPPPEIQQKEKITHKELPLISLPNSETVKS